MPDRIFILADLAAAAIIKSARSSCLLDGVTGLSGVGPMTSRRFAVRTNHIWWPALETIAEALLSVHAAALRALRSKCGRSAEPISGFDCGCRLRGLVRWWRSPTFPRSTIQHASPHRSRWERILGLARKGISPVRPTLLVGLAKCGTVRCVALSMRRLLSS